MNSTLEWAIEKSARQGRLVELPYSKALSLCLLDLAHDHALVSDGGALTTTAYGRRADGASWGVRLVQRRGNAWEERP